MHGLSLLDLRRHAQGPGKAGARGREARGHGLMLPQESHWAQCALGGPLCILYVLFNHV